MTTTSQRTETMDMRNSFVLGGCMIVSSLILVSSRGSELPRFQVAAGPGHAYIVDTKTGEVWEEFSPENSFEASGNKHWMFREPKLNQQGKIQTLSEFQATHSVPVSNK